MFDSAKLGRALAAQFHDVVPAASTMLRIELRATPLTHFFLSPAA
jgi:hypothetical protein